MNKTSRRRSGRLAGAFLTLALLLLPGCGSDSGADLVTSDTTQNLSSEEVLAQTAGELDEDEVLARSHSGRTRPDPTPRPPLVSEARSLDGTGNSLSSSAWGSSETLFRDDISRAYADGISEPSGQGRPNPREVSNAVVAQSEDLPDPQGRTAYLWLWGQFLDHDITLTHENGSNDFPIGVPVGDPWFDPFGTGTQTIPFSRSTYQDGTGTDPGSPRAQVNSITAFIDGSMVYGSDEQRAAALRTFSEGRLATSDGDLPPYNTSGLDNAGGPGETLFLCGDVRANENVLLTAMHTLWVREHNRIADQLQQRFPEMDDEQLYQAARKRVGALIQVVTYEEFLPALLGRDALPPYRGYKSEVDPSIGILFATAAYRLGHSQVGSSIPRLGADGDTIPEGDLVVADAFFNPTLLSESGIDPLLRGAVRNPSQTTDPMIIDDLRNLLFGPPGSGGLDLASLNLQRGRDHGLPDYNTVRTFYGMPAVTGFDQITTDPERQADLAAVYDTPDQLDPWVGLLSEDPVPGGAVGPTLRHVLADQFRRLRDGDRFFYLNDPDLANDRERLRETRLSDIIARNTEIDGMPRNVFQNADHSPRPRPRRRHSDRRFPAPSL